MHLFITSISNSQNCIYEKNTIDKFTGEEIKITKLTDLCLGINIPSITSQLIKIKTSNEASLFLNIKVFKSVPMNFGFNQNQKLYIMLTNDSIITLSGLLVNDKMYFKETLILSGWYIDNKYLLSVRDLSLLKQYEIETIRVYYFDTGSQQESYWEYSGGKLFPKSLMKHSACL